MKPRRPGSELTGVQEGRHGHIPWCYHLHHGAGQLYTQRLGHRHIPTKKHLPVTRVALGLITRYISAPTTANGRRESSPFQVFLLLTETGAGQSRGGFAQVANEIIAEVEGQRVLARQQPPDRTAAGDGSRRRFNFSFKVRMKPDEWRGYYKTQKHLLYRGASE